MVVVHDTTSGLRAMVVPHTPLPRRLRKYLTFTAPLNNDWKLFAGARGSNTPTYSGGVVTGAGAVLYADDPLGTGLLTARASGVPQFTSQGYQSLGAIANVLTYSCAFDNAAWIQSGTPAPTANETGPDGTANSAYTLTDNSAAATEGVYQGPLLTAATYTKTLYVKKTVGAQASYPLLQVQSNDGIRTAVCTIDTTNGVATVWTARTGWTVTTSSATCTSFSTTYWRVSLTFLADAQVWNCIIFPAGTTNATQSTGIADVAAQGSCVCWGASLWNGAFAYPGHLQTQAVAASRSADVGPTYATAGNTSAGPMSALGRFSVSNLGLNNIVMFHTDSTSILHGMRIELRAGAGQGGYVWLSENASGDQVNGSATGSPAFAAGVMRSVGFAYGANDAALFTDGVLRATDTSVVPVTHTNLSVGYVSGGNTYGNARSIMLFGVRLANLDMSRLSTQP